MRRIPAVSDLNPRMSEWKSEVVTTTLLWHTKYYLEIRDVGLGRPRRESLLISYSVSDPQATMSPVQVLGHRCPQSAAFPRLSPKATTAASDDLWSYRICQLVYYIFFKSRNRCQLQRLETRVRAVQTREEVVDTVVPSESGKMGRTSKPSMCRSSNRCAWVGMCIEWNIYSYQYIYINIFLYNIIVHIFT